MKILLLRHAESMGNASGDYSTAISDSLSPSGREQAATLVAPLMTWSFDAIIASPLQRAMETITPYLEASGQRAEIWPETAEACWQERREEPSAAWQPQRAALPDAVHHLFAYRGQHAVTPAQAESFGEGLRRVHETMDRLQAMADPDTRSVLLVSHGHFLRELIKLMLGIRRPVDIAHENCGMTLMSFNGEWSMEFCNRRSD